MKFKRYLPLLVLFMVSALAAFALVFDRLDNLVNWIRFFMGSLFCQFSMLKLFNLTQFADGFQKYDWIARRSRGYAYTYPFIELGLGLAYLSGIELFGINIIAICLTAIGAFGVLQSMKAGLDVRCACMGTILDVPLSTVTLTEDLGMGIMALFMLIF